MSVKLVAPSGTWRRNVSKTLGCIPVERNLRQPIKSSRLRLTNVTLKRMDVRSWIVALSMRVGYPSSLYGFDIWYIIYLLMSYHDVIPTVLTFVGEQVPITKEEEEEE